MQALTDLLLWADARIEQDWHDRPYVAEYLTDSLFALTNGEQPEPPPF
jgi:hypothetical protein